jgi:hypothetical protein
MQDQNVTPKPTTLTLAVTVTLAGEQAADVADDLAIDADAGDLDQAMTNLLRAHLANHGRHPRLGALSAPP